MTDDLNGKMIGVRLKFMAPKVRRMWNPKGGLEVIDVGHNVYFFKFSLLDEL